MKNIKEEEGSKVLPLLLRISAASGTASEVFDISITFVPVSKVMELIVVQRTPSTNAVIMLMMKLLTNQCLECS